MRPNDLRVGKPPPLGPKGVPIDVAHNLKLAFYTRDVLIKVNKLNINDEEFIATIPPSKIHRACNRVYADFATGASAHVVTFLEERVFENGVVSSNILGNWVCRVSRTGKGRKYTHSLNYICRIISLHAIHLNMIDQKSMLQSIISSINHVAKPCEGFREFIYAKLYQYYTNFIDYVFTFLFDIYNLEVHIKDGTLKSWGIAEDTIKTLNFFLNNLDSFYQKHEKSDNFTLFRDNYWDDFIKQAQRCAALLTRDLQAMK